MFSANNPRPEYNPKVLKESFEREKRYFRIHEVYNPSLKQQGLTSKFYSPHELMDLSLADSALMERIELFQEGIPKQKYPEPVTDNQVYGWVSQLLVPLRKGDSRYYAARKSTIAKVNFTLKKK